MRLRLLIASICVHEVDKFIRTLASVWCINRATVMADLMFYREYTGFNLALICWKEATRVLKMIPISLR